MGLFDKLKRKKDEPNIDITLSNLKVGYILDYDLKTWEVTEYNKYDWGDDVYSYEWELTTSGEVLYLEREDEDDEVEWTMVKRIPIRTIDSGLGKYIQEHEDPPEELKYEGTTYYLDDNGGGYFCKGGGKEGAEFLFWDFVDKSEDLILSVEQWSEERFEAVVGKYVEEYEFTNILPR
ncbi:MAG: DUF4178 domain-containing protein [Candidatus Anammoxibacter sp.]